MNQKMTTTVWIYKFASLYD